MAPEPSQAFADSDIRAGRIDDAIVIRQIALSDANAAAELSAELGYPADVEAIGKRIDSVNSSKEHVVYVACISNRVAGWIDVGIIHLLSTGAHGEIRGLVVASEYRSRGIGRKLVARAEQWVADQGITSMIVRSRISRQAAHRFYVREGYSMIKTSAVFSKQLKK